MAKNHVGRPTNEEILIRKRKKIFKFLIPGVLIIVLIIFLIHKTGLINIMGNATYDEYEYYCEEGLELDDGTKKCYKESDVKSLLIGNVVDDGYINEKDVTFLRGIVDNTVEYTSLQYNAADVNQDGVVDKNDVEDLAVSATGYMAAPAYAISDVIGQEYVCPSDKTENGNQITYSLKEDNNAYCVERIEKDAQKRLKIVDDNNDMNNQDTSNNMQETEKSDIEEKTNKDTTSISTDDEVKSDINNTSEQTCVIDSITHKINCNRKDDMYSEITSSDNDADELVEREDKEDSDNNDDNGDAYLEKTSNYLKYADANIDGYITINTTNSLTGGKINQKKVSYTIYTNDNCSGQGINTNSINMNSWKLTSSNNNIISEKPSETLVVKYNAPKGTSISIKQNNNPIGYDTNNECKKFTFDSENIVEFKNVPLSTNYYSYIGIDNSIIGQGVKYLKNKYYASDRTVLINSSNKSGYIFDGWTVQRKNGSYLCYSTGTKKISAGVKWGKCKNRVIVKTGNNIEKLFATTRKNGETLIFQSQWIHKSNIKVTLKNSKNKNFVYNRHASLYLYNDLDTCKKDVASGKRTKARKNGNLGYVVKAIQKSSNSATNKGIINISKDFRTKKIYYLNVDPAQSTYQDYKKCIAVNYDTKKLSISLNPRKFSVKFDKNGGKGNMSSLTKIVDVDKTISKSKFTKDNYDFDYWTASRKYTDPQTNKIVTQYRCYTNSSNFKTTKKRWMTEKECKTYGMVKYGSNNKKFILRINAQASKHPSLTLIAHWKKSKYKVTLKTQGGSTNITSFYIKPGETFSKLPTNVTRKGYRFEGWSYQSGKTVTKSTIFNLHEDITLYASWYWLPEKTATQSSKSTTSKSNESTKKKQKASKKSKSTKNKKTSKKSNTSKYKRFKTPSSSGSSSVSNSGSGSTKSNSTHIFYKPFVVKNRYYSNCYSTKSLPKGCIVKHKSSNPKKCFAETVSGDSCRKDWTATCHSGDFLTSSGYCIEYEDNNCNKYRDEYKQVKYYRTMIVPMITEKKCKISTHCTVGYKWNSNTQTCN